MNSNLTITIAEVCGLWGLSKKQVHWAIWQDKIRARQCCFTDAWLVDYESCVSRWGDPKNKAVLDEIKVQSNA